MEQSPSWEVNRHSATEEIPQLPWEQNIQYSVHKNHLLDPILSQSLHVPTLML